MLRISLPLLLLLLGSVEAAATKATAQTADRPNILFIFTDDQRFDAVGYAGNPLAHTPNLDRLARQGTVFERAYVTTSICAVSRASVLTGQYARRHGVDDFYKVFTPEQLDATYPALLRAAGYYTGFIGKWGIGDSPANIALGARLFDYWAGASHQTNFWHERDCRYVLHDGLHHPTDNVCDCPADDRGFAGPEIRIGRANLKEPVHLTSEITPAKVEQFLATRDPAKPFCLSVFMKAAHSPFEDYDPQFATLYQDEPVRGLTPDLVRRGWERRPRFLDDKLAALAAPVDEAALADLRREQTNYLRLVANLDYAVGKMLAALDRMGLSENTVIVFASDNGQMFGEHGMKGKWLMYEPSIRVPLFIYDPRARPASTVARSDALVLQIDATATILDYAGVPVPAAMQGRSLLPFTREPGRPGPATLFYEHAYTHNGYIEPTEGVVSPRFKYTRYYAQSPVFEELFDLERDPDELHNLAADPGYAAVLTRLREAWAEARVTLQ